MGEIVLVKRPTLEVKGIHLEVTLGDEMKFARLKELIGTHNTRAHAICRLIHSEGKICKPLPFFQRVLSTQIPASSSSASTPLLGVCSKPNQVPATQDAIIRERRLTFVQQYFHVGSAAFVGGWKAA